MHAEPDPNRPGRWRVLYHGGAIAKTGLRKHQAMNSDGTAAPSEQLNPRPESTTVGDHE